MNYELSIFNYQLNKVKNKYGQLEIIDSIAIIWFDMENSPQNVISPEMINYVDPFLKEVAMHTIF